jgi:hypothetical protein
MLIVEANISISRINIDSIVKELNVSWVNPRITDFEYPFDDSFASDWNIQALRIDKKMKFEDIIDLCKQDGYEPANIFHLFNFVNTFKDLGEYKSLMAPGSLCVDDFECGGCIVLNKNKNELKLGLANWRDSKIGRYDILRVKKII